MITLDSFSSLGEAPRALVQDVLGGRAPHAVLITGIAGTGKRTLARLLACALLCVGEGQRPCMQCKGCRRVLAGTHPDLLTPSCTDKDRTIKVDHLREVLRALSFHALEGRRVILLENAQRMTVQAQNALLKLLEEPPPQAAKAAPIVTTPEASRKLRREIFFIRVNLLHGFPIKKFILKNSAPGVVGLC